MSIFSKKEDKSKQPTSSVQPLSVAAEMPRAEVRRVSKYPNLMSVQQVQRTREALRLAETKLQNAEESLEHLKRQQDWLRRYNELKLALNQENARLYDLKKQQSSMAEDIRALDRYQTFETIQSDFLRMKYLEQAAAENKRNRSVLDREQDEAMHKWEDQQKLQQQMTELREQAQNHLYQSMDQIAMGHRVTGALEILHDNLVHLDDTISALTQDQKKTSQEIEEKTLELDRLNEKKEQHRLVRQGIEIHEGMVTHGEAILLKLDQLHEIRNTITDLRSQQSDGLRRQNEENEQLGRIFSKFQEVEGKMQSLNDEIHVHRESIKGQNSFVLQERAMRLKSRHQMLLSAQSLWNRISTGYSLIEEKARTLNALRLHIEHVQKNIHELDTEVSRLNRLSDEKRYTYMLSKSQSVIQLRSDLKEGVQCSVCGATHHPYHSDTMLEQSKLIGEFKTDYELLSAELRGKRQLLDDLRLDLAESKGRQFSEESSLNAIRIRQNDDVKEWSIYSSLDPSYKDCSPSTNQNARMAMIRHMIESTGNDAETAQKELDIFNYHMSQITRLGEELQALELQKKDLSVRLNEVNTGCQVRAGQVERVLAMIDNESTRFSEIYHHLEEGITIKDWKGIWDNNHEALREQIVKLANAWNNVNEHIQKEEQELELYKAQHTTLLLQLKTFRHYLELVKTRSEDRQNRIETNNKTINQTTNEIGPKQLYEDTFLQMVNAKQAENDELKETIKMLHEIDYLRGRNEFHIKYGKELSEMLSGEHSRLDIWIRNFNMHHPPVQYSELQEVFSEDKDWAAIRSNIQKIRQDITRCQTRVDDMNSRFIALQAEGNYHNADNETLQESLSAQMESLEGKLNEVMMQIARQSVILEEHEKAIHTANNSALNQAPDSELC